MSLPHIARICLLLKLSKSLPSKIILLFSAIRDWPLGNKPMVANEVTDLPLPDSPTKATVVLAGI